LNTRLVKNPSTVTQIHAHSNCFTTSYWLHTLFLENYDGFVEILENSLWFYLLFSHTENVFHCWNSKNIRCISGTIHWYFDTTWCGAFSNPLKPIISSTPINKSLSWPPVVTIDGRFSKLILFYKYVSTQSVDVKNCSGKDVGFI